MSFRPTLTATLACALLSSCSENRTAEPTPPPAPATASTSTGIALSTANSPFDRAFASTAVSWRPWGDEAFDTAKEADRPIFLFIGYTSCPWCAKMRRGSFSDPAVAGLINENFIPVLADADSLPGVNRLFMRYLEATRQQSGWPLCVWLTPDRLPITAGNYFPATADGSSPAFTTVLKHVADQWKKFPEHYKTQTRRDLGELVEKFKQYDRPSTSPPSRGIVEETFTSLAAAFDPVSGGFGSTPKFPSPIKLDFLLNYAAGLPEESYQRQRALAMVTMSLDHLASSATHDLLAGGFFRYSQHASWNSPNFEKMLDDQALLARTLMRAAKATGDDRYNGWARSTLTFVLDHLSLPGGGFASALASESVLPDAPGSASGVGTYYTWTPEEIASALRGDPAKIATATSYYNISLRGNLPPGSTPHDDLVSRNTLHLTAPNQPAPETIDEIDDALLSARGERPAPQIDSKIILEWNAILASAFVHAARDLGDTTYLARADELVTFLLENFTDPQSGHLVRTLFAGNRGPLASSGDYAALIAALIDLHSADPSAGWLDRATAMQTNMDGRFLDSKDGGYWDIADRNTLFYNLKPTIDGTRPSANSQAAQNLLDLAAATGDPSYLERARATISSRHNTFSHAPDLATAMISAIDSYLKANATAP